MFSFESAVGQLACGDGTLISQEMLCSDQICDLLAKDAATANQISSSDKVRLVHNLAQLKELLLYLGRLTHEVNHFTAADGTIIRDSTAEQGLAARRRKRFSCHSQSIVALSKGARSHRAKVRGTWPLGFKARAGPLMRRGHPCTASGIARTQKSVAARKEAEFQYWWREERGRTLKSPTGVGVSAKDRIEALRARVAAKSASLQSVSASTLRTSS